MSLDFTFLKLYFTKLSITVKGTLRAKSLNSLLARKVYKEVQAYILPSLASCG